MAWQAESRTLRTAKSVIQEKCYMGKRVCYSEQVMVYLTHLKLTLKIEEPLDHALKCQLCMVLANLLKM